MIKKVTYNEYVSAVLPIAGLLNRICAQIDRAIELVPEEAIPYLRETLQHIICATTPLDYAVCKTVNTREDKKNDPQKRNA